MAAAAAAAAAESALPDARRLAFAALLSLGRAWWSAVVGVVGVLGCQLHHTSSGALSACSELEPAA